MYIYKVTVDGRDAFVFADNLHEAFHTYFGETDAEHEQEMKQAKSVLIVCLGDLHQ